jgi:hypothetical protein
LFLHFGIGEAIEITKHYFDKEVNILETVCKDLLRILASLSEIVVVCGDVKAFGKVESTHLNAPAYM